MIINMLKELVASLSILVISDKDEVNSYIGKEYLKYCKKLKIVETIQEAQKFCDYEEVELVVINADRFGRESLLFVEQSIKKNMQRHIIVSARQFGDTSILVQFANLGVNGFISKSSPIEEVFPMLLRVCNQMHEHAMMKHYMRDLEEQITQVLNIPACSKECPREATLAKHIKPTQVDDSFDFFPDATEQTPPSFVKQDQSIYQDYFTFLMGDDRDELHDVLSEIDVLLLNTTTQTFVHDSHQVALLGEMLSRFGNTLMHYQFFSDTGIAIIELGQTIVTHRENMGNKGSDFDALLSGFCSVLLNFMNEVWEKEAEDPKFFNDSIINDAQMICTLVAPSISNQADDDLIFF